MHDTHSTPHHSTSASSTVYINEWEEKKYSYEREKLLL